MGFVRNLLTKDDNDTFDEIKVAGFILVLSACVAIVGSTVIVVWMALVQAKPFDANSFLNGIASILASGALVVGSMATTGLRDKLGRESPPPLGTSTTASTTRTLSSDRA